jgi:hypothetical protein
MAKAEQRSSSRSKIQPFEPSVPTLEAWNMSSPGKSPIEVVEVPKHIVDAESTSYDSHIRHHRFKEPALSVEEV